MAYADRTIWEVQTGGDDTNNGGAFDPSATAGMLTDGAATSATGTAPVFSSASYNFVAGDVGAWVFIASGTNWTPGWYKISSVASNQATLDATSGHAVLLSTNRPTTSAGCATVASPSSATWSIDYSQQASPKFTYTDLASTGAGLTVSSAAHPFGKQMVGNAICITSGTNFTAGRWTIASVNVSNVATVRGTGNITSGAGSSGVGALGGALASAGKAGAHMTVDGNMLWIASGSYNITSASTNIAGGCLSIGGSGSFHYAIEGYGTVRGDLGTRPVLTASGAISTFTMMSVNGTSNSTASRVANLEFDCASKTASSGLLHAGTSYNIKVSNATANAIIGGSSVAATCIYCEVANCTSANPAITDCACIFCYVHDCQGIGIQINQATQFAFCCIVDTLTTSNRNGFQLGSGGATCINCVVYNVTGAGYAISAGTSRWQLINCVAISCGTYAYDEGSSASATISAGILIFCAAYNSTTADTRLAPETMNKGFITLLGDPFTNSAGGDFSLNNTAGAGALLRNLAFPSTFPAALTANYLSVGAAQLTSGGGSTGHPFSAAWG